MPEAIPYKIRSIPMTGRLIEALDPISVGENFRELKNLRPLPTHKRSVAGMTKITSTPLTFQDSEGLPAKIRNGIHFIKEEPYESHVVVEAYNYAENSLRLYTLDSDTPGPDDFGNVLYSIAEPWAPATITAKGTIVFPTTYNGHYYECLKAGTTHGATEPTWPTIPLATIVDSSVVWICRKGSLHGAFSVTTAGALVYANSHVILIWPGEEHTAGAVVNASRVAFPMPDMDDMFDYTDHLQNTFTDDKNIAIITGLDSHSGHYDADVYIGSPYKIDGAKFYIQTPVGYTPATANCETAYWASGGMQTINNTDATAADDKTLTQTGSVMFTEAAPAEPSHIFGRMLYWFRFRFHNVPASGANRPILYFLTVHAPIQPLTNIWDGTPTPLTAVWKNPTADKYVDQTLNVAEADAIQQYGGTTVGWIHNPNLVMTLNDFGTSDFVYFGSFVRLTGLQVTMAKDCKNKKTAILRLDYFKGKEWMPCSDIRDGTANEGKSLFQSGTIIWSAPDPSMEFKTCVNNDMELYYYRMHWSTALGTTGVRIDKVVGVPDPVRLTGHTRAFVAQDRLFLVKDNTVECSPVNRPTVMNGSEHVEFVMGDESAITGGCHLFAIQGSEYYSPIIIFKKTATYLLTGDGPDWKRHELSRYDGLAAPDTLCVVNLPITIPGMGPTIAIGQGTTGVFLCDGRPPRIVSKDIEQYFDPRHEDYIQPENLDKSVGFMDYGKLEYHWLFVSGNPSTGLEGTSTFTRKEMVLCLQTMEWYEIDRGSQALQCGFSVQDIHRTHHTYGVCDDGHIKRLEDGTDFDGDPIVCTMWPGDVALAGNDNTVETRVEQVQLLCLAKTITDEDIAYDHYLDTSFASMKATSIPIAPRAEGRRVAHMIAQIKSPPAVFHSGKVVFSCDDEAIAFEPLAMMYHYEIEKQRVKPNQGNIQSAQAWLYSEGD